MRLPSLTGDNSNDRPPVLGTKTSAGSVSTPSRKILSIILGVFLGVFLVDALVSFFDESLIYFGQVHLLGEWRLSITLLTLAGCVLVYGLMALTPAIPKQLFAPVALFFPISLLAAIPFEIFYFDRSGFISWLVAFAQLIISLWIIYRLQGRGKFSWAIVPAMWLAGKIFTVRNLVVFIFVNVFILLPLVFIYLFFCAGVALERFSGGFMTLSSAGIKVQSRSYINGNGQTIELVPMMHVGDANFYQNISQSFPSNSIILMEGVTDEKNLLTNKISYQRLADSLGLKEQREEFKPAQGTIVRADVDVDQFSTNTLALLNLIMGIHVHGANTANLQALLQSSPSPNAQNELFDDLLQKRNQHLIEQIQKYLPETKFLVVPWGAAHMPGIAKAIQKSGFRLVATHDYMVIRFFRPTADSDNKNS